ncbi:MAG: OmpA family protein [Cyclobacteriaceae bacterium]
MRIFGFLLALVWWVSLSGQVKFYSNPEPVLNLNSPDAENYIYLSADGGQLIYTKENSASNAGGKSNPADLWFADVFDKYAVDSIKSLTFHDPGVFSAPIGITQDGLYLLFSETKEAFNSYSSEVKVMNIKTREKSEVEVPYLRNIGPIQTGFLSRDGKVMLLSLENNTGYGVDDLYFSLLDQNGRWSAPKNLGGTINTDKQELTPFLLDDNKTLYFATNARGGMGSFDIYFSMRLDDTWRNWSEPKNLGSMVNSEGSETSFMFNPGSEYAYFVSTQNSDGYGDIKRIRIYPTNVSLPADSVISDPIEVSKALAYEKVVNFKVKHAKTDEELSFSYFGKTYRNGAETVTNSYDAVTEIDFGLNANDSLGLDFKSKGFLSQSLALNFNDLDSAYQERIIRLEPLETGNTITLEHVLFKKGTPAFLETSKHELELVLEMMNENPDISIYLKGHTDNVGNKVLNIQLSQARVNAVRDFLVEEGIDKKRISGKGFGGSRPVASNREEETRRLNRRVEFEVIRN